MPVLSLHGVGVAWEAAAPLFGPLSLTLERGFYGLVGANGAGKTTFLSVLAGELEPTTGKVLRSPPGCVVAHCPQRVERSSAELALLAAREDGLAGELRGRLGLEPQELERWETLSPGERKRWQLAAALALQPDILLLDEPTNHLDAEARARLLSALGRFRGLGVLVSHDRSVLDTLTTATLRIHQRTVTLWPGRYSEARRLWEQERTSQQAEHAAARERVRVAEAQLDAARRIQAAASRNVSAGARMKNRHDSDARGILASTKAQWAASKAGRITSAARTQVRRAEAAVPHVERDATLGGRIFANYERAHGAVLFHLDAEVLHRGDHAVLREVRVTIGREERVRLEGANGAGKTTLLEALVASFGRPERLLYLPQELSAEAISLALQRLRGLGREAKGGVLSLFAALGSEPERLLATDVSHISPGEARKLVLAEALSQQVWALVLDEPTNHLDLPSVERLEAALVEYPGAVVLVTHDDTFASRVTTRSLRVEGGTVG